MPAGARRTGRAAARGPVDRDPRPGRGPAPGAGRAAHRLGQVGGLLHRHRAAARPRRRADRDRLPAARADAQPGRGGGAGRHPRAHHQLGQHRASGSEVYAEVAAGQADVLLVSPERLNNPGVPRPGAARAEPPRPGCWWSTRRTASPTGATTSGPTTGGCAPCWTACRAGDPGPGDHGDRERAGDRRRRRAARRRRDGETLVLRGAAGPGLPAAGRGHAARRAAAARLAGRAPRRAARLRHHLHADGRGGARDRGLPARAGP